jgi:hypothetical protein
MLWISIPVKDLSDNFNKTFFKPRDYATNRKAAGSIVDEVIFKFI